MTSPRYSIHLASNHFYLRKWELYLILIPKLMLSVMGAIHEFDRALIKERQREGITLAKKRGAFKGRKKSLSQAEVAELHQKITAGISKAQVAREYGISRETLYQYLRQALP
jgi:DNA invertase Pin-like site-specific DNA recombinase